MRQAILNRLDFISKSVEYIYRKKGSNRDLLESLPKSLPITKYQKKEILNFWKPYLKTLRRRVSFDLRWYDVFNRTNVFGYDLRNYIPNGYYFCILESYFTDVRKAKVLDDKNMYDLYFHNINRPKTLCRKINGVYQDENYNIISENDAVQRCIDNGNAVIKPAVDAMAGSGIVFWKQDEHLENILKDALVGKDNYVVQDTIKQHSVMASLNQSSVNTMRLVTFLWNGEVILTTAVVIMGGAKSKTNHLHGGGLICAIEQNGQLKKYAFDGKLNQYETHPNGTRFANIVIPNYRDCVDMVKRLATRFCRVSRFISWDITLDENCKPLLIEMNLTESGSVQVAGGPVFGDKTKDVLDYVTKHGVWK